MEPLLVNHDTLDDTIHEKDMLIVDMWASWCAPCRRFSPIFEEVAQATPDVTFGTFQVDSCEENQEAFDSMGFRTVPTVLAFKGGTLITATSGALGKADLTGVLDKLRETVVTAAN